MNEKRKWQKPELIVLTRNNPEDFVVKTCCKANYSLSDSGCNGPLTEHD
jgi:hypothetical protein